MMIFTTLKIAQAIINPCRTLATITRTVVAREVNKANILRIAVIASPTKGRDRLRVFGKEN
jgi:hypothetical protein